MKQLRQISILVRGAQLLLLVLALFLVVWLVPDAGKKHASGTEASEAETDGGDVAENEKNGASGNLKDDGSSAGNSCIKEKKSPRRHRKRQFICRRPSGWRRIFTISPRR